MSQIQCFEPIENPNATVLILGSMPGKESLRVGQYYAHRRNAFWHIMGDLIGAEPILPYEERIQKLRSAGIALWDVLASCTRLGSLDADIEADSICPNNFATFFLKHPYITHVYFNGSLAEQSFKMYVLPSLGSMSLHYQRLPSTSPANASFRYEKKLESWQAICLATGAIT